MWLQGDRRRRPPSDGPIINTPLETVMETEVKWIETHEDDSFSWGEEAEVTWREVWHSEPGVFLSEGRLCGLLPTDKMILSNCR